MTALPNVATTSVRHCRAGEHSSLPPTALPEFDQTAAISPKMLQECLESHLTSPALHPKSAKAKTIADFKKIVPQSMDKFELAGWTILETVLEMRRRPGESLLGGRLAKTICPDVAKRRGAGLMTMRRFCEEGEGQEGGTAARRFRSTQEIETQRGT